MHSSAQTLRQAPTSVAGVLARRLERLRGVIERATESLPAQGPITVFIHHNTLHSLEDLTFEEAVHEAGGRFNCEPYLAEDVYRTAMNRGRIAVDDLMAVLSEDLGPSAHDLPAGLAPLAEIRFAMLTHPLRDAPSAELRWFVAETDALKRFCPEAPPGRRRQMIDAVRRWTMNIDGNRTDTAGVDDRFRESLHELLGPFSRSAADVWDEAMWESLTLQSLWRVCLRGARTAPQARLEGPRGTRHRDWLREATGADSDLLVDDLLIRFCGAFLDQGYAAQVLPDRRLGLWSSFLSLYGRAGGPPEPWRRGLVAELLRIEDAQLEPLECIEESLRLLNVPEADWADYLTSTLLALRGWAGMIWQMEQRQDRAVVPAPIGSLTEFLAVRLVLDRLAVAYVAREELGYRGSLADLRRFTRLSQRSRTLSSRIEPRAFVLFQLAQTLGWSPIDLARLNKSQWTELFLAIEDFPAIERRRVWHLAFERRYRLQTLDALAVHRPKPSTPPRAQVLFCLDEREESMRRHLEEAAPDVETFGAAGFFSIPMYFRGAAEAHFVPLCPIVIRPQHWVAEEIAVSDLAGDQRARRRRVLGQAWHRFHVGSRDFTVGALLAAGIGAVTTFPMVARVLFPRLTAALWRRAGGWVRPPNTTTLRLERQAATPGDQGDHIGFSVDEMVNMAERLLRDIGLTADFAPLVIALGHGSNSVNNPHKSAYDCGACGGNCGGPNARALAEILNDPRVRERLAGRGIRIPRTTVFVGGFHNTCDDSVQFFDADRVPVDHQAEFERIVETLNEVGDRNAHERCRRFMSAPLDMTPAQARRHVEGRSEDLAQTRPECGHATNALCIVGRRQRTKGLFLDRRAFLVSYDPEQDTEDLAVMTRILQAIVPVCAGINLEYYFSYVDPTGWGCGTKLPHNVTSLLGIMDGAASDLRTGLPWQMVEIHEPVRLLFVLEAKPERVMRMLERNPVLDNLVRNGWVRLATVDPDDSKIHYYEHGGFQPHDPSIDQLPQSSSSIDWYRGWRDHLPFAAIEPTPAARN